MLQVVREEREPVIERHGGNGDIRGGEGDAFAAIVTFQLAGQAGYGPGDGLILQTFK